MSGDEGASGGDGKELRAKGRKDYAKMHKGVGVYPDMGPDAMDSVDETSPSEKSGSGGSSSEEFLSQDEDVFSSETRGAAGVVATGSGLVGKDPDEELASLEQEMKKLEEEKQSLIKAKKVAEMRKAVSDKKKEVKKLRGRTSSLDNKLESEKTKLKPKQRVKKSCRSVKSKIEQDLETEIDEDIDIKSLRKDSALKKLVRKELVILGLQSSGSSDSSSDSSSSDSSSSSSFQNSSCKGKKHKKKKKQGKKKSGIKSKASDKVKNPQKWSHAHLQYEYVNKQVTFEQLDFKMFIVGEREIISGEKISKIEKVGRLDLLKKIIYYSSTYDFKGLKAFYAAWLREIELGKKSFAEDSGQLETAILSKHLQSQKPQQFAGSNPGSKKEGSKTANDSEKVWFCKYISKK